MNKEAPLPPPLPVEERDGSPKRKATDSVESPRSVAAPPAAAAAAAADASVSSHDNNSHHPATKKQEEKKTLAASEMMDEPPDEKLKPNETFRYRLTNYPIGTKVLKVRNWHGRWWNTGKMRT